MDSRTTSSEHTFTSQHINQISNNNSTQLPNTVVVALEILQDDPLFAQFKSLSVSKKIDVLLDRIISAFHLASAKATQADFIIVACREYALTGPDDARTISAEESKYLKEKMLALSQQNPKLIIALGGIGIHKSIHAFQIAKVWDHYEHPYNQKIIEEEQNFGKQHSYTLLSDYKQRLQTMPIHHAAHYRKIKNTSYLFHENKIARHAKATPFYECQAYSVPAEANAKHNEHIFQPAKGRNLASVFYINAQLSLGITICREDVYETHHATLHQNKTPCRIDFLFSDFIEYDTTHRKHHPTIHLDSAKPAMLVLPPHLKEAPHITLYKINCLQAEASLEGPVKAIYPLQYALQQRVNDQMNSKAIQFYDASVLKPQVSAINKKIAAILGTKPEMSLAKYDEVIDALTMTAEHFKSASKAMSIYARHCYFLYSLTTQLLHCTVSHVKEHHPTFEKQLMLYHPTLIQHLKHAHAYMPAYEQIEVVTHPLKAKF